MSTTTTPLEAAAGVGFKTYTETYVRFGEKSKKPDGSVAIEYSPLPEKKAQKRLEEAQAAIKEGKLDADLEPTIDRGISFSFYEVTSADQILELVPNEVEACNLFNRGVVLKQQMAARDYVMDEEFAVPEGVFDLKADAAELHERKKQSPEEKALKALTKVPGFEGTSAAELAQLLELFKAQRTTA